MTSNSKWPSIFIGIDPGKHGAIAIKSAPDKTETYPMPLIVGELNVRGIGEIFADIVATVHAADCFAVIEKQQCFPRQGGVSNFSTGYGYGALVALLTAHRIPFEAVRPQEWKKTLGISTAKGAATKEKKAASIQKAQQLFPSVSLVQPGHRKPHDGIAEALLICTHAQRIYEGRRP